LRARLVAGLVVVALGGLIVADVVVYSQVGSYLTTQIDTELGAVNPLQVRVTDGVISTGPFSPNQNVPNSVVEVVALNGSVIGYPTGGSGSRLTIPATVLTHLRSVAVAEASGATVAPGSDSVNFTTTTASRHAYRVLAEIRSTGFQQFAVVLVGIPLSGAQGTLHQLLATELLVTVGVLLLLLLVGYVVVRIGLRPLGAIELTAAAIAAGDLSRRVESDNDRTEVGRLGRSLNVMLTRIEQAFSEQRAAERRLRQFISDASHELRTPVTSIRGYAELFRRGAASRPEDLALAMRRIEDESIRMGGLVEDLLLLARLDEGRPIERAPVDLAAIAADCVADASVLDPSRTISLDAPVPVIVDGDGARLGQIVANLLQNAIRYTPEGSAISVSARSVGERATLSVSDEGPGIEAEHAARIFERFYRGDASRTRQSGGSGLGLAIVASIAEAHGGIARVETELGRGSRFIVDIPLTAHPTTDPRSLQDGSAEGAPSAARRSPDLESRESVRGSETGPEEGLDGTRIGAVPGEDDIGHVVGEDERAEIRE
jgi:two-component system OmpR family sensor kinase